MTEIKNFEDLKEKIKDIENFEIISEILDNIKSDKSKEDIINCINACTSPVNVKEGGDIKTIFNAFSLFSIEETRVLILGQDPYPSEEKADGCAFSVKNNQEDDSLLNIFKAVKVAYSEENIPFRDIKKSDIKGWCYDLKFWAKNNNVLLLNTTLTHKNKETIKDHRDAWEPFINEVIKKLISSENSNKLVVFLWGKYAQCTFFNAICEMGKTRPEKCRMVRKMILMTSHPSNTGGAVNLGFSKDAPNHFKACDEFLKKPVWKKLVPSL